LLSSLLPLQIIIDIAFFVTIVLLLQRLNKRIAKGPPAFNASIVHEFNKLMKDSQDFTNHFLLMVEENRQKLTNLALELDNKEKRLIILIEEAEALISKVDSQKAKAEPIDSDAERYGRIVTMIQEGRSREEVAKRLGVAEGEINLIVELEHARSGNL
jgi:hypothetical protein